jgi:hypothetical protein
MIIDHTHPQYIKKWQGAGPNERNGAYYYSREIVERIIPAVNTDRNWITVNIKGVGCHNAIVFIHNNIRPECYDWMRYYGYKNLICVCGVPETCEKVAGIGTPIYLPLSIDVDYVKQFAVEEKTKDAAFVGRPNKKKYGTLPDGIDYLEGMPRDELLRSMAEYKNVYAVGRCALEAKALGCKIKKYDNRFPKVSMWKVMDNLEAAEILQKELDRIDG